MKVLLRYIFYKTVKQNHDIQHCHICKIKPEVNQGIPHAKSIIKLVYFIYNRQAYCKGAELQDLCKGAEWLLHWLVVNSGSPLLVEW